LFVLCVFRQKRAGGFASFSSAFDGLPTQQLELSPHDIKLIGASGASVALWRACIPCALLGLVQRCPTSSAAFGPVVSSMIARKSPERLITRLS